MANRDSWQFNSVLDFGSGSKRVGLLGRNCQISVESYPSVVGQIILDGLGNELDLSLPGVTVQLGLPNDTVDVQLTGRVRIFSSTSHFIRDPGNSAAQSIEMILPLGTRDAVVYRHRITAEPNSTVYVTVAYEESNGLWCFSPDYLFGRELCRGPYGVFGRRLYDLLPSAYRSESFEDSPIGKLSKIFGSSFDDASSQISGLARGYDIDKTDAGRLAYIDRLIGWPTHLLVGENLRRLETLEAVSIYKNKSTRGAIDYAIQQTIGWSASVYDGKVWVLGTNFIQEQQPADWIEGQADSDSTDDPAVQNTGIWNDEQEVGLKLWSPADGAASDSPEVGPAVLPDFNSWKHPGGVLVSLSPTANQRTALSLIAINRARSLALQLVPHYVDVHVRVAEAYAESLDLALLDESDDDVFATSDNSISVEFSISHQASVGYCPFNTYPLGGELNDSQDRLIHTALTYTCNQGGGGGGGGGEFVSP